MKILCVGHAAYDITIPLDEFPIENTKNRVSNRVECGGGPASNAAYLLGKWGLDVTFLGVVGNDEYGKRIIKEFNDVDVNTKYMLVSDKHTTTSSFIISNRSNGSRTILTYRPDSMVMPKVELDFEPDIILMDGQEYELSKELMIKYPNAITIMDAGRLTGEILLLAKMSKYVISSHEFAEDLTEVKIDYDKPDTLIKLYQKMEEEFGGKVIVTLESHGSLYKEGNLIKIMPSIKVKAVDSTGAGDIYHGAFTYGIARKMNYENIIRMSNVAGAISVTRIGGRYSVPTIDEMKEYIDDFE